MRERANSSKRARQYLISTKTVFLGKQKARLVTGLCLVLASLIEVLARVSRRDEESESGLTILWPHSDQFTRAICDTSTIRLELKFI